MLANPSGQFSNVTATGQVFKGGGQLLGFYVNSTTSGTIVLNDSDGVTATAMSGTITPAIGYHAFPATVQRGVAVTIANTLNVTLFFATG